MKYINRKNWLGLSTHQEAKANQKRKSISRKWN